MAEWDKGLGQAYVFLGDYTRAYEHLSRALNGFGVATASSALERKLTTFYEFFRLNMNMHRPAVRVKANDQQTMRDISAIHQLLADIHYHRCASLRMRLHVHSLNRALPSQTRQGHV